MDKLCIYHGNCADGFGAYIGVLNGHNYEGVEGFAATHGGTPPDVTDREVIMVDFCYKAPVMKELAAKAKSILILDHHKSAMEDMEAVKDLENVTAIFDMDRSGAMMAWEHFNARVPQLIHHIQDRDLWRFKLEGTREIQQALFSYEYDVETWKELILEEWRVEDLAREGKALTRKHIKDIHEFLKSNTFRMNIAGHNVPVVNLPYFYTSEACNILAKGEPFAAGFWFTEDGITFSLRSTDDGEDVSKIATIFGGGGHRNAAGFSLSRESEDYKQFFLGL